MNNAALSSPAGQNSDSIEIENKFPEPVKVIETLRPVNQLPPTAIEKLASVTEKTTVASGESITELLKDRAFVYYLITGSLQILEQGSPAEVIRLDNDDGKNALDRRIKESNDVVAAEPSILAKIPWGKLEDLLLEFAPSSLDSTLEVKEILATTCSDWMVRLLQSELLSGLPASNIQQVMSAVEPLQVRPDEMIIQQGDAPDHFYIIEKGEYSVIRHAEKSGRDIQLAKLKAGEFFGEEALITGNKRGTSVKAVGEGMLLKVHGDTFTKAIVDPTVSRISTNEALEEINSGAVMLDVREPERYAAGAIPNSENLVLKLLRINSNQLDKELRYVTAADEPNAAALAAFLLRVRGFDVASLDASIDNYATSNSITLESSNSENTEEAAVSDHDTKSEDLEARAKPTLEEINKLGAEHTGAEDNPADKDDYAHTVTGIGLADLIEELHGTDNNAAFESEQDKPNSTELADPTAATTSLEPTSKPEAVKAAAEEPTNIIEFDPIRGDEQTNAEIEKLVEERVAEIRTELRAEMTAELAKQKAAAMTVLKSQQQKMASQYRTKQQALLENSKKLIALANKISHQKAEVQAARKALAEEQAKSG